MLRNDETYFYDDGNVVFQVESTLFRVHRHFFVTESPVFRLMLSSPFVSKNERGSLDCPILLKQVKCKHFSALLWFFYHSQFSRPLPCPSNTWAYILRLARDWRFDSVFSTARRKLSDTKFNNPIIKIRIALEFKFCILFALDACIRICERPRSMTIEEASILPIEMFVTFAALREIWHSRDYSKSEFRRMVRRALVADPAQPEKWKEINDEESTDVSDNDHHMGYESTEYSGDDWFL